MAQIRAAGCVLFRRQESGWLYLLLRSARHGDIGLPKGHLHEGEDEVAGCVRETAEETGLIVSPGRWFERRTRYEVKHGTKEVVYFVAESDTEEIALSNEHDQAQWLGLVDALCEIRHRSLRDIVHDAAAFLKDPALRGSLNSRSARALCEDRLESHIVAHVSQVAAMARVLAEPFAVDADFVEACAWLHDIGRAVDHARHPVEGYRLLDGEGHPAYAPCCVSHYTRGRPYEECGPMRDELWRTCDLSTFPPEEQLVALADFLAAGDRRTTLAHRYDDLCARYGRSAFLDRSLSISQELLEEWERATGLDLYGHLGIA